MKLSEEQIVDLFNVAGQMGHPDPYGFVARAEIKSGFDTEASYKNGVGLHGISKNKATREGFEDISGLRENTMAAIAIDMSNFTDGNVRDMFAKSNPQSGNSNKLFMRKLDKTRAKWKEKLDVTNGVARPPKKEEKPKDSNFKTVRKGKDLTELNKKVEKDVKSLGGEQVSAEALDDFVTGILTNIVSVAK